MRFTLALALALGSWALGAETARADEALRRGRDVVFLQPTTIVGVNRQVVLEFETLRPDEDAAVAGRILAYEPLARQVVDYRWQQRSLGRSPMPLYISFGWDLKGTSYCVKQPFLLHTEDASGKVRTQFKLGPVIHLSARSLNAIKGGKGAEGLGVLCHETGHALMATAYPAALYPGSLSEGLHDLVTLEGHWYNKQTDPLFAYSEGWAEFCEHFYCGTPLPRSLLRMREGEGAAARERALTHAELRRCEGAQAYLLLAVARGLDDPDLVTDWVATMASKLPRTMNGLLVAYTKAHPERRADIDRLLHTASEGAFALEDGYGTAELLNDQVDSWRRLGKALSEKARELEERLAKSGEDPKPEAPQEEKP